MDETMEGEDSFLDEEEEAATNKDVNSYKSSFVTRAEGKDAINSPKSLYTAFRTQSLGSLESIAISGIKTSERIPGVTN